jgi:hypothetical protein
MLTGEGAKRWALGHNLLTVSDEVLKTGKHY